MWGTGPEPSIAVASLHTPTEPKAAILQLQALAWIRYGVSMPPKGLFLCLGLSPQSDDVGWGQGEPVENGSVIWVSHGLRRNSCSSCGTLGSSCKSLGSLNGTCFLPFPGISALTCAPEVAINHAVMQPEGLTGAE